jgi:hypothetical protein
MNLSTARKIVDWVNDITPQGWKIEFSFFFTR